MNSSSSKDLDIELDDAIARADVFEVEVLLNRGADPNFRDAQGWTPLMNAAWVAAADVVRLLLSRGADLELEGPDGKTAIDLARSVGHDRYGHSEVIKILGDRSTGQSSDETID